MVIGICDDDICILKELKTKVEEWIKINKYDVHVIVFNSPSELLKFNDEINILFLDVEMPDMDGFTVAENIRRKYPKMKILFLTSHKEMIQQAFKVQAFRYFYKPIDLKEINEGLNDAFLQLKKENGIMVSGRFIRYSDIVYVESIGDESVLHLINEELVTGITLKQWMKKLGDDFFQCHKSFIVSLGAIKAVKDGEVAFTNSKKTIPVSIRKKTPLKNAYYDYIKRYANIM